MFCSFLHVFGLSERPDGQSDGEFSIISGYGIYAVRWESFTDNSLSYRLLLAEVLVGALVLQMDYAYPEDPPKQLLRGHSPRVGGSQPRLVEA